MALTLILMRHAKSDWAQGLEDHARPLNPRGRKSAKALGDWLRSEDLLPDEVISSDAVRTRETLAGLALGEVPTRLERGLYLAESDRILALARSAIGRRVLLLGHNPGIGDAAQRVLDRPVKHPRFRDYPTGATLVATVEAEKWPDLRWTAGRADRFVVPRELI